MGGYSKEASNMPDVQQTAYPNKGYVQTVEHHQKSNIEKTVLFIGDTFGWFWVLTLLIVGAIVVSMILFKEHIKKVLGSGIKWADKFINGD